MDLPEVVLGHLHSVLESVGAVTALMLSYFLRTTSRPSQRAHIVWARPALIGMGTFDLIHAIVRPGNGFVWLHSLALVAGGLFFSLVWLPERISESGIARALPRALVAASLTLGLASLLAPQALPTMLTPAGFTTTARAMNTIGGGLFLVACAWYVRGYLTHRRRREDLLFGAFCLLSGIAGALFPFSELWDHQWWLWHAIRLLAYFFAAWFLYDTLQHSIRTRLEEVRRQEHFRTITETATDAIISIDKNRMVTQWNSAASRMFGYTADEALGRSLPFIMAEDVRSQHEEGLRRVLTTGEIRVVGKTYESVGRRRDGSVFPVEISLARWEANGEPYFAGIIRDTSERKRLETALRESKAQVESAHQLAHIGVWTWDVASDTISWSDELCRILGWEPGTHPASLAELQGLYTPESWERLSAAVRDATGQGTPYDIELEAIHRDGRRIWTQAVGGSKCDGDGRLVQLFGTVQDISERKRVAALFETRLQLLEYVTKHSLEEFLQKTLDEVEKATGSCIGFFHFLEEDQNTIALQAWSTRTLREFCIAQGKGLHYSLNQAGVWVDAIRERRPVIHNDYASLPHRKGLPEGHAPVIRELVVPISDRGRLVAVLGVGNKPADYTEDDVRTTSYLADVAWQITNRKRAEELAQQLSVRNEALLAAVPDIIMEVDDDKVYTWANPAGYAFFGADVLGREAAEFFIGEQETYDRVAPLFRGDKDVTYVESWQRRCDGEVRLLAWWCRTLRDETGAVTGALSSARDITDRKRSELEQDRLRRRLEAQWEIAQLTDASFQTLCDKVLADLLTLTGSRYGFYGFLDEQEAVMRIHAWSRETMQDCGMRDKPIDYPVGKAGLWGNAIRERRTVIVNDVAAAHPFKRGVPAGHVEIERLLVVPVSRGSRIVAVGAVANKAEDYTEDDAQDLREFLHSAQLLIESSRNETALRQSEEIARLFIEHAPVAIAMFDREMHYVAASRRWLAVFRLEDGNITGRSHYEVFPEIGDDLKAAHQRCLKGEVIENDEGSRFVRADGSDQWLRWASRPWKAPDGTVGGIVIFTEDITEKLAAGDRLKALAETQAVLLREVNHRVKNNLTVIISMLHKEEDRLRHKGLTDSATVLQDLHDRIESLLVVHTMLSAGKWQDLDLGVLCRKLISVLVQGRSATAHLTVAGIDVTVNSNQAHYLALVLNELATNSLKYASKASPRLEIRLRTTREKGDIRIEYRDNGPGYPEAVTRGDYSGTSIGFDLMNGLVVQSLRGRISFHNDHGAVAMIRFPAGNSRNPEESR